MQYGLSIGVSISLELVILGKNMNFTRYSIENRLYEMKSKRARIWHRLTGIYQESMPLSLACRYFFRSLFFLWFV